MAISLLQTYICRKRDQFSIVPVLVGSLDRLAEREYGKIFSRYMEDPENVFVISSDFCHWGKFYDVNSKIKVARD